MMQKIKLFPLIEILSQKNPNLDFSIKREQPLLFRDRHFKRLTRAQAFSLSEKRQQALEARTVNFRYQTLSLD